MTLRMSFKRSRRRIYLIYDLGLNPMRRVKMRGGASMSILLLTLSPPSPSTLRNTRRKKSRKKKTRSRNLE